MSLVVDKNEKLEVKKLGGVALTGLLLALAPEIRGAATEIYQSEPLRAVRGFVAANVTSTRIKIAAGSVVALLLAVAAYEFIEEAKLNAVAEKRMHEAESQKKAVVA